MRTAGLKTVTISGWGQPADALSALAPAAPCIDFARHASAQAALLEIEGAAKDADIAIGWSLGGQLLVRAVAAGLIRPTLLVLLATPFQFVARPELKLGMPSDLFEKFRDNYRANPAKTLHMAQASIVRGDDRADIIREHLSAQDIQETQRYDWLHWLDNLGNFSCESLYMADFPDTLLIHGDHDAVVFHAQSEAFARAIPHARLVTLPGCGHAPHWHHPKSVRDAIEQRVTVAAHG